MRFAYDAHYVPAAPMIEIRLGKPNESLSIGPLYAFVDTGADITLIPIHYVRQLRLRRDDFRFLRSQWGERRSVSIYSLDMGIDVFTLPAVAVVGDEQSEEIVLGRNVLNKLMLTLNGPKQFLEVSA